MFWFCLLESLQDLPEKIRFSFPRRPSFDFIKINLVALEDENGLFKALLIIVMVESC